MQNTTQSKYRKKKKDEQVPSIEANEVRIKGNQGHVKRYVDYAVGLLEGDTRVRHEKKTPKNDDAENDADKDENNDGDNDAKEEPKKFDTIVLKATGRAINKAVTTAEVVKRRVRGLHQVTSLETLEITDVWEPLEQGLKEVETKRRVASITITLSRAESDIDKNAAGYQVPISADAIKPFTNYSGYNRNNRRRGRGRGRGRRGGGYYNNRQRRGNYNNRPRRGRGGGGYNNRQQSPQRSPYNNRRRGGGYGGGGGGRGYGRRGGYGRGGGYNRDHRNRGGYGYNRGGYGYNRGGD